METGQENVVRQTPEALDEGKLIRRMLDDDEPGNDDCAGWVADDR